MYKVLDIAKYIIKYSNQQEYRISNLKLQKLLYFVQAKFLLETGAPCFKDKIEAWDIGPVVPNVYREFMCWAGMDMPADWKWDEDIIEPQAKERINSIVEHFRDYSAVSLTDLTRRQSPWIDIYNRKHNAVISNESIKKFFDFFDTVMPITTQTPYRSCMPPMTPNRHCCQG